MLKIKLQFIFITVVSGLILCCTSLRAQVPLPYFTGFDNAAQKAGWSEYRKAATSGIHWAYATFGAYSPTTRLTHDYSPSSGITLMDNWYVSPPFSITSGGTLDSIRYKFNGMSVPVSGDTIAVYLLEGSPDPSLASSKTLLFDFRNSEYVNDNTYRIKTNFTLPASGSNCHIAIRYRNSNCSVKWLTVSFDNIGISGISAVGVSEPQQQEASLNIYPNPSSGNFMIGNNNPGSIDIFNLLGENLYSQTADAGSTLVDLTNFPKGIYILKHDDGVRLLTKKICIQ